MKRSSNIGTAGVFGGSVDGALPPVYFFPQSRQLDFLSYPLTLGGSFRLYLWGSGGGGNGFPSGGAAVYASGGSGALAVTNFSAAAGDILSVNIPPSWADASITLPDGRVITAGKGGNATLQSDNSYLPGVGGVATGGDINIAGTAGSVTGPTTAFGTPAGDGGGTNPGKGGLSGGRTTPNVIRYAGAPGAPGYDEFKGGDGSGYVFSAGAEWMLTNRAMMPGGAGTEIGNPATNSGNLGFAMGILKRLS